MGAAYIEPDEAGHWTQTAKLQPVDLAPSTHFVLRSRFRVTEPIGASREDLQWVSPLHFDAKPMTVGSEGGSSRTSRLTGTTLAMP